MAKSRPAPNRPNSLPADELRRIDAYWRACNYLAAGMIYLRDNPLLREPLKPEHIKNRLLGHWGASPGLSFIYVHLNRLINKYDLDAIFLAGPGHGAPGRAGARSTSRAPTPRSIPNKGEDEEGMREFFKEFSFPGGIGSHCTPETPGSIHEGGELGYSISHAFGAAFDNPDLLVAVVGGRRRGRDRAAGHLLALQQVPEPDPRRRGAADPAPQRLQDQQPDAARAHLPRGTGRACSGATAGRRTSSKATTPATMHQQMAATLEHCVLEIRAHPGRPRAAAARPTRRALADDRAAQPQGLDRARRRSTATRWRASGAPTRCRWPACTTTRRT